MFKNYFKIAVRNLWRNKGFSAINILGLSIGIATCVLILLLMQHELSYDRFHEKANQIVRVVFKVNMQGDNLSESHVMPPVAQTLRLDYPEVLEATRLRNEGFPKIKYQDKIFTEDAFGFVDSNFFQVFTFPFINGNKESALLEPNSIVITNQLAKKYFGAENPIGKLIIHTNRNVTYKITGIIEDIPYTSHIQFQMFASMSGLEDSKSNSWMTSEYYTYLVLSPNFNHKVLEAKLPIVMEKYLSPQMSKGMGMTVEEFRKKGNTIGLFLQPLTEIHLHSSFSNDLSPAGDIRYVYIYGAIALFMLTIACINFMNLSTASASKRAKEVGIRKVLGSLKFQLAKQFIIESLLVSVISIAIAIFITYASLPFFNKLAGKNLTLNFINNPWAIPMLFIIFLLTGFLAGSYPAFYLSSFNPINVLKGRLQTAKRSITLRSSLVIFQFTISIILIISSLIVFNQLTYIQNKKLGFNKDMVLVLPQTNTLGNKESVFSQELLKDTRILNVSASGYLPAGPSNNNNFFIYPEDKNTQIIKSIRYDVDENYIPTLGIDIKNGRNFLKNHFSDSLGIILNETATKALGIEKDPIGRRVTNTNNHGEKSVFNVIGVVKDFHFKSMHELISPLAMVLGNNSGNIIVKTNTNDIPNLLETIKKKWNELNAETPFTFSFMDDRLNSTYQTEQKTGFILALFAGITIFVACMGLFGLAMFIAEQRNKEIGVRKVLGASVFQIVSLLSLDFLKLVFIAGFIAFPISNWLMNKWLADFAYRVNIGWIVFLIAGVGAITIALGTISYHSIKAALANPVKSFRRE